MFGIVVAIIDSPSWIQIYFFIFLIACWLYTDNINVGLNEKIDNEMTAWISFPISVYSLLKLAFCYIVVMATLPEIFYICSLIVTTKTSKTPQNIIYMSLIHNLDCGNDNFQTKLMPIHFKLDWKVDPLKNSLTFVSQHNYPVSVWEPLKLLKTHNFVKSLNKRNF